MRTILCMWLIMTYCKTVGFAVAGSRPDEPNGNNVFIVTLDGLRWQELFFGADASLIDHPRFTKDSGILKEFFWHRNYRERRKKLMPFFWTVIAKQGQLFGNRFYDNKVNVSNFYALSYPGYNEIFTGKTDPFIFSNEKIKNWNRNILEYFNDKTGFKGKVASFTSWSLFPYIFNKDRSNFYLNSQRKLFENTSSAIVKDDDNNVIRNDFETYTLAKKFIVKNHPKIMHIGLSGVDTYGHKKMYDHYLYQAHLADKIIGDLWQFIEASAFYRKKTTLIITADHGRGSSANSWHNHGFMVKGSSQTWVALLGNGVKPIGECRQPAQLYQQQIAGTVGYFTNMTSYSSYTFPLSYFMAINNNRAKRF